MVAVAVKPESYVRNGKIFKGVWFQCVYYCEQGCSSYAILCAHESDCSKRREFTRRYDDARRKHSGRVRRGADWNRSQR